MPKATLRIPVPRPVEELLKLANLIYERHKKDDKDSPLNTLKDYDWNTLGPNIALAAQKQKEAEELSRQAEKAYRERDKLMGDVVGLVTASKDLLKGVYRKNPKKLGDWGFQVDDTPKVKKTASDAKQ